MEITEKKWKLLSRIRICHSAWQQSVAVFNKHIGGRPPRDASAPCKLTISSYSFARWLLFWHFGYLRHQQQVDLWPFDLESGVRVTCDVGYLSANFSLPRPLLELRQMYAIDIQTDKRKSKASFNASALWRRRHNKRWKQKLINNFNYRLQKH